jgi:Ca-activated chloride channel family protein
MVQGAQVPLRGVRVEARLTGLCAEVTVAHRYQNTETVPVEAVYVFPLEEGAAVCGFRARVGGRLIEGQVQEREKAFETYDNAMSQGHGAFLLDQERPNIFTASVGNLKPGEPVEVEVSYVAQLQREGEAVRFFLPTTISPRYSPAAPPEVGQPDHERVNPPRWREVPYGLTLEVEIEMSSNLKAVESPSHKVRTELDGPKARVTLSAAEAALDRDFILLFEEKDALKPSSYVAQEADGTRVVMVTFSPGQDIPQSGQREILFVLDCSGSMDGDSIQEARRALALCVRAMSEGDRFNIYRFGSSYQSLWPDPQPYNQQNLEAAAQYAQASTANLGGTEILAPLQDIARRALPAGASRQILLLTDGQVSNEAQVIELCKAQAATTRVFAFGIGAGVSEHLVKGVSRASRGAAEFIHPGERIEPKVLRMFNRVTSPMLADVRVDWGGLLVEQSPSQTPPVFAGESLTVFGRVASGTATQLTLKAGEHAWAVSVDLEKAQKDGPIPRLWARNLLRDLEDGEGAPRGSSQRRGGQVDRKKERLIELGVKYGLVSSATSYVAVELRNEADKTTSQAQLRQVPTAMTAGWGGQGSVGASTGAHAPVAAPSGALIGGVMPQVAARARTSMPPMAPPPPPSAAPMMPVSAPMMPPGAPAPMAPPAPASFAAPLGAAGPGAPADMAKEERARGITLPSSPAKKSVMERAASALGGLFGGGGEGSAPSRRQESLSKPNIHGMDSMEAEEDRFYAAAPVVMDSMELDDMEEAAPAPEPLDRLFDVLLTQQADGSFKLSAPLLAWLGARAKAAQQAAQQHGEALVATALVLALLEREASSRKDEWEGAARKARRWMDQQPAPFDGMGLVWVGP